MVSTGLQGVLRVSRVHWWSLPASWIDGCAGGPLVVTSGVCVCIIGWFLIDLVCWCPLGYCLLCYCLMWYWCVLCARCIIIVVVVVVVVLSYGEGSSVDWTVL